MRPHRRQPTRLPRPWDSPGKNTGVGWHFLLQCMKVKSESEVAQSVRLFTTPGTAAYPPSMGFSRQEYWSGVPLPSLKADTNIWMFKTRESLCFFSYFGLGSKVQLEMHKPAFHLIFLLWRIFIFLRFWFTRIMGVDSKAMYFLWNTCNYKFWQQNCIRL